MLFICHPFLCKKKNHRKVHKICEKFDISQKLTTFVHSIEYVTKTRYQPN